MTKKVFLQMGFIMRMSQHDVFEHGILQFYDNFVGKIYLNIKKNLIKKMFIEP